MCRILVAGFEGENNSAKILLDKLSPKSNIEKLYLKNDFEKCAIQIIEHLNINRFINVIAFGQKPLIKSVYIEMCGDIYGKKYETAFQYKALQEILNAAGYKVKLSYNAGKYLCNHVYAIGLHYIERENLEVNYLFIHIPIVRNLKDIDKLANSIEQYIALLTL